MTTGAREPGARLRFALKFPDRTVPMGSDVVIVGRGSTCSIMLDDAKASRLHARLRPATGGVILEDLSSANGTFVDGKRIYVAKRLTGGESVRIGKTEFVIHSELETPRQREPTAKEVPLQRKREDTPRPADESDTVNDDERASARKMPIAAKPDPSIHLAFLEVVREDLDADLPIPVATADRAGQQALELALHSRLPAWVDFTVKLFSKLGLVMPSRVRNLLEQAVETVPGCDREALLRYARVLETLEAPASTVASLERLASHR